jgi:Na+-driven multidrug efflux pump
MGSAIASVIQYASMMFFALGYVLFHKDLRSYVIRIFSSLVELSYIKQLMVLSFPVMIDKAALACSYIWIGRCLAPMGTVALASFSVIKDLERFSFLPAIAFAQVITFLVSNDYAKCDWDGIKSMIKKIIFLSSIMVFAILIFCSTYPEQIIRFFDFKGEFCCFAAKIFPVVSVLVFLDVLQLILAGALRGAANVSTVMWTRLIVCALFTAPVAYLCSLVPMENQILKFVCIYGSLYVGNGIMCIVYIRRFRGEKWKRKAIKDVDEN